MLEQLKLHKEKIIGGIIILVLLSLLISSNISNAIEKNSLKKEMLIKSDEVILVEEIKNSKQRISELENLLKVTEENKRKESRKESCLKQQLDRLVEGLEYRLDYCKDNLDKFQGL